MSQVNRAHENKGNFGKDRGQIVYDPQHDITTVDVRFLGKHMRIDIRVV